jgi:hypothetical protein
MIRSFAVLSVGCALVVALGTCVGTSDGDGDGEVSCTSPLDCELGESCRDGVCSASGEGEGEGGEGEGENQDAIITSVCQRLSSCQGADPNSCINDLTFQLDDMRSRGTDVCLSAADAMLQFFSCVNGLTCQQMQEATAFCPVGQEASNLQNQCFNGSGEGEGEQECISDADCFEGAFCFDGKCVRKDG